ncbi:uncharacterized protein LOC143635251 isoform X2 [Bidens hawaiensis]|uniref:uncharacterized protein LOC143635251 isoform X2 n=1 Tax=Bidens hawaiensis TaxID=980011 RepID=UPI00404A2057
MEEESNHLQIPLEQIITTNNFGCGAFGKLYKKDFECRHFSLEEIKSATNNFHHSMLIGEGGFGHVYKGHLPHSTTVAVKCLHPKRRDQFFTEIALLTRLRHPNLVSLLGFCNEADETILVYEYMPNGSLDRHITSAHLTWSQRLKIAVDAARGLAYLHEATGNDKRILHRDIKPSSILLDAHWSAKLSDFGLSRRTVPNTAAYLDPPFFKTRTTDVYCFGIVLVEMLSGRYCNKYGASRVRMWKKCYKQNNNLQEPVFNDLKQQMDGNALKLYSDIAFKCLQASGEERPSMSQVVKALEAALDCQMLFEGYGQSRTEDPPNYKELLMITVGDPLSNIPETELKTLLFKGTLIYRGRTWFSLNKEGQHCEMISIAGCLTSASESQHYIHSSECNSRFPGGCYDPVGASFKTRVQARFLSPGVTYAVNLVFKNKSQSRYIGLEYKLKGELSSCFSFVSDEREDGWLAAELYQFTTDQRTVDLEICFYTECCPTMLVEGIEFRPLKKADHEALMEDKVDMQLDIHTYFDDMLSDYEDMIKRSKDSVQWKSKKELISILCKGFQLSYGEEWFYLDKHGKKCLMLPARAILEEDRWTWNSEPETRFEEVACCNFDMFGIYCKFNSKLLSPETTYAAFLVYELPDDHESVDQPPPVQVVDKDSDLKEVYNIFLRAPQTPVISWNEKEERTFNPLTKPKGIKGLPKQRSDGWMEVQVHEFQTRAAIKMVQKKAHAHEFVKMISTRLKFSGYDMSLKGVIVQGLEFRPTV